MASLDRNAEGLNRKMLKLLEERDGLRISGIKSLGMRRNLYCRDGEARKGKRPKGESY